MDSHGHQKVCDFMFLVYFESYASVYLTVLNSVLLAICCFFIMFCCNSKLCYVFCFVLI